MEKEWTIIFLIYANFADEKEEKLRIKFLTEQKNLLQTLSSLPLNDKCELLLIINNILFEGQENPEEHDTISITRYASDQPGMLIPQQLETLHSPFMLQKSDKLGELFNKIHNNQLKFNGKTIQTSANRYFLNTFDHGSAFGIFKSHINGEKSVTKDASFSNSSTNLDKNNNEIISNTITPTNIYYGIDPDNVNKAIIIPKNRYWDKSIINYNIPKLNLQFELRPTDKRKEAIIKLMNNEAFTKNILIRKDDKKIYFEMPEADKNPTVLQLNELLEHEELEALKQVPSSTNNTDIFTEMELDCEKETDYLTNEELANAISIGFKGKKIDCLLMMNCLMMNLHNCYALKDNVEFIVAPQGSIDIPGYNYNEIFVTLLDSAKNGNSIDPESLSRLCVESLRTFQSVTAQEREVIEKWAVFSFNLSRIGPIADLVDIIGNYANFYAEDENAKTLRTAAQKAISVTYNFEGSFDYEQSDITHFLKEILKNQLIEQSIHNDINNFLQDLYSLRKEFLCKEHWSSLIYNEMEDKALYPPMGLSIYLPEKLFPNECLFITFIHVQSLTQSRLLKEKKNWIKLLTTLSK